MDNFTNVGIVNLCSAIYALHLTILESERYKAGLISDVDYKTYIEERSRLVNNTLSELADIMKLIVQGSGSTNVLQVEWLRTNMAQMV